ncbi:serine hydrolase [Caulobacter segnis]|nr:serine hydrolase [Caulobacter segnis]MDG2520625.1 serine hydrolase [Caulobacter segnis]
MQSSDVAMAVALAGKPLKFIPGEPWWCSNLGYALLASLVGQRSGMSFDSYVERNIFQPSWMAASSFRTSRLNAGGKPDQGLNYDYPHRYDSDRVLIDGRKGYYSGALLGAANIVSTAADFLKLDPA